jgi:tRNA-uridine 2-sulfurtransferase
MTECDGYRIGVRYDKVNIMSKKRVLLGMSGGVDSSVSAVLLLEQGYEVVGAFMKNWDDCDWRSEKRDAMRVAAQLGIDFKTFDFEDEYHEHVYEYMVAEYEAGRTPNPDVLCNKYMKFGFLLREVEKLECNFIATGHYARTRIIDGLTHLLAGVDQNKDQSYFLCRLSQDQLKKILFPIGELEKNKVREIAKKHNLVVAEKKDSQGICFVGKVELVDFLKERIPEKEGDIITVDGKKVGVHKGHQFYTIGQRSGLGIGGTDPYYVVERRPESNEVVVAHDGDEAMFKKELTAVNVTETIPGNLAKYIGKNVKARIRYRQPLQECSISIQKSEVSSQSDVLVKFDEPQRAVAPGQFIAFYDNDELIGSGVIR